MTLLCYLNGNESDQKQNIFQIGTRFIENQSEIAGTQKHFRSNTFSTLKEKFHTHFPSPTTLLKARPTLPFNLENDPRRFTWPLPPSYNSSTDNEIFTYYTVHCNTIATLGAELCRIQSHLGKSSR